MKRLLVLLPVLIVAILGIFLVWGLNRDRDPNAVPSALEGKAVPRFELGPIPDMQSAGLSTQVLENAGELTLVNFFASWCVPCKAEHSVLTRLASEEQLKLYGINYKDKAEDAKRWLADLGNPYLAIGFDDTGRTSLEWGLSGVPETFLIDESGVIRHRFRGPIVGETAVKEFYEVLAQVRAQ